MSGGKFLHDSVRASCLLPHFFGLVGVAQAKAFSVLAIYAMTWSRIRGFRYQANLNFSGDGERDHFDCKVTSNWDGYEPDGAKEYQVVIWLDGFLRPRTAQSV